MIMLCADGRTNQHKTVNKHIHMKNNDYTEFMQMKYFKHIGKY
jgi:hypothetical protein